MNSYKRISLIAGIGYLIIFFTGFFSNFYVLEGLASPLNPDAALDNIIQNEMLFRSGLFGFVLMVTADVILAWALYILLKPVNKNLSLLSGWLRLVNGAIFAVALFNLFGMLQLAGGADYLNIFAHDELNAKVLLLRSSFDSTWLIGLVFFGIHLLLLGYLIFKSGYVPKLIGVLLFFAGIGYLVDSTANFLMPNYKEYKDIFQTVVMLPGIVGELSFTIWLLVKGVRLNEVREA